LDHGEFTSSLHSSNQEVRLVKKNHNTLSTKKPTKTFKRPSSKKPFKSCGYFCTSRGKAAVYL